MKFCHPGHVGSSGRKLVIRSRLKSLLLLFTCKRMQKILESRRRVGKDKFWAEGTAAEAYMLAEFNRPECCADFMSRMLSQFEQLLASRPECLGDTIQELRRHEESLTFLDAFCDRVPGLSNTEPDTLRDSMQKHGYYASVQGSWLVCAKSKKRHDTMLFAAQASEVLAHANMMLVPAAA